MNIIELAKQAGFQDADWNYNKGLEKFAALVAAATRADEREACAKLMFIIDLGGHEEKAANTIRARGTT